MPLAARFLDMHECPMMSQDPVPIPHVGGPLSGPGEPTVLIGSMPAACKGDLLQCIGDPDVVVGGSSTVLIGGRPAARLGDVTAHGGRIVAGCLSVLIGD